MGGPTHDRRLLLQSLCSSIAAAKGLILESLVRKIGSAVAACGGIR